MDAENELRRIRGIGAARAGWLQTTFDLQGLADLAALEPDEISRRLAESGRGSVSRDAVASWVAAARELTSAGTHEMAAASPAPVTGGEREGDAWRPRASFVVEFQSMAGGGAEPAWRTTAHHVERDGDEVWPGIDCDGLSRWMTGHLAAIGALEPAGGDPVESSPDALRSTATPEPEPGEPVVDLRARVVDGDGYRGARLVRIDAPWAVDLCWDLGEAPDLAGPGEWRIDLSLWPIGESAPLELPGVVVPSLGDGEDGGHRHRMEIQAGRVTSAHCGAPYRATATLTFHRAGDESAAVAGAVDLGFVRFYDPSRLRRRGRERPATRATGGGS